MTYTLLALRFQCVLFSCLFLLSSFGFHDAYSQCINTFPYFEDFENGPGGWTDSVLSGPFATPFRWTHGSPAKSHINASASGTHCWMTGPDTSNYASNSNAYVQSPCFDFSSLTQPVLAMNIYFDIEDQFDGAAFFSSVDTGKTWQLVGGFGTGIQWFNSSNMFATPGGSSIGWSGSTATKLGTQGWVRAQQDLSGLGGESHVLFRVVFSSDLVSNANGFAFDDMVIREKPSLSLGPDKTLCGGAIDSLNLGQGGAFYIWSTNDTSQVIAITSRGMGQQTYWGCITDSLGFVLCDTVTYSFSQTQLSALRDTIICPGASVTFDAKNATAMHQWATWDSTCSCFSPVSSNQQFTANTDGIYSVTISDSLGCTLSDTVQVVVDILPQLNLNDTIICAGQGILVGTPHSGSSLWTLNGSPLASTPTIFATAPGTYRLVVTTLAGCVTRDSFLFDVAPTPLIYLGPDYTACDSVTLNAQNPGFDYLWSTGETTQTIRFLPPKTVSVRVYNQFGCESKDTISIGLGTLLNVNLGKDRILCPNKGIALNAGVQPPGTSFQWSNGAQTQTTTVGQPGLYFVIVTNADGCQVRDSVTLRLTGLRVDLGSDKVVCAGKSVFLNAQFPDANYLWNTGSVDSGIWVNTTGLFHVVVTDKHGCQVEDSIRVTELPAYTGDFSIAPSWTVGFGDSMTFTASAPMGTIAYEWNFGDGQKNIGATVKHKYVILDTFDVCLRISDGQCADTICKPAGVYRTFQGLADELSTTLAIYPNPSEGVCVISFDQSVPQAGKIDVVNIQGKKVYQTTFLPRNQIEEYMDLRHLPAGIYLLRLNVAQETLYRKLIIR